ncbi:uncharacterized protein LOC116614659 [Nematostella vectensis]|uniref:uncharacterized protein LOC116614659 n=1 Tax=Nematostella vectensis TaxID=45351 RepID=UPI00138FF210|nr:uncharacterized protein LOC116614659 [Nematostella vectensis]XP_048589889.1 uncharacterized protein LOC116614659 [Nematostella vectensis]
MAAKSSASHLKDIEGYVHKVLDVKVPATGNRYFDFKVQEREKERRVVCFSPDSRSELREREESKQPVKLESVSPNKRKFEHDAVEYKFHSFSKVSLKNPSFPLKDVEGEHANASIKYILENCATDDIVALKGKVLSKGKEQHVHSYVYKKDLRKCELVIGDSAGAIPLTVWEEFVKEVEVGQSYTFSEIKVGYFKRRCISTTPKSTIKPCEALVPTPAIEVEAESFKPKEKVTKDVNGSIVAVDARKQSVCINCKNKISDTPEGSTVARCNYCKLMMKTSKMDAVINAHLVISGEDGEIIGRYRASSNVLKAFMDNIAGLENYHIAAKNFQELSKNLIPETLLCLDKVFFKLDDEGKVVKVMKVVQEENVVEVMKVVHD